MRGKQRERGKDELGGGRYLVQMIRSDSPFSCCTTLICLFASLLLCICLPLWVSKCISLSLFRSLSLSLSPSVVLAVRRIKDRLCSVCHHPSLSCSSVFLFLSRAHTFSSNQLHGFISLLSLC